jgi:hypothetical protein
VIEPCLVILCYLSPRVEYDLEMVLHDASEWPPTSRTFLQRGGSVGAVATMLFEKAMEDPLHMETFEDEIQQLR